MGVGERRGGHRAGGHRRPNHHHNHHNHHNNHHHGRNHGNRRIFQGPGISSLGWRPRGGNQGNQGGPPVAVTPVHCSIFLMLIMLGMFGFLAGMILANIGGYLAKTT